jgi:hypothetical protein
MGRAALRGAAIALAWLVASCTQAQAPSGFELTLIDVDGRKQVLGELPASVYAPRVSPDGTRVAFKTRDGIERRARAAPDRRILAGRVPAPVRSAPGRAGVRRADPEALAIVDPSAQHAALRACFRFDSGGKQYRGPMLTSTAKKKRFLEAVQLVLTFVSVCAVLETGRLPAPLDPRPGYYAGLPHPDRAFGDRRLGDLARADRKRREADQQSTRRRAEVGIALEQRELRA